MPGQRCPAAAGQQREPVRQPPGARPCRRSWSAGGYHRGRQDCRGGNHGAFWYSAQDPRVRLFPHRRRAYAETVGQQLAALSEYGECLRLAASASTASAATASRYPEECDSIRGVQARRAQCRAQPRHQRLQGIAGIGRLLLRPEPGGQDRGRHHPASLQREQDKEQAQLPSADGHVGLPGFHP